MNSLAFLRSRLSWPMYVSPDVTHQICAVSGLRGLSATAAVPANTILACVPVQACISPSIVRSTPAGRQLNEALQDRYTGSCGGTRVSVSRDTVLVAAFTALSMIRGPLKEYLSSIPIERDPAGIETGLRAIGGDALWRRYANMRAASEQVLESAFQDIAEFDGGLAPFCLDQLCTANALCESRVLDIPGSVDLGGPVLAPFFDLINHEDGEPNVTAHIIPRAELPERLQGDFAKSKYCIVGAARCDIAAGEALHYSYLDPLPPTAVGGDRADAALMWALRFHFIPKSLHAKLVFSATTSEPVTKQFV